MVRYIIISGILFGDMDGIINIIPLARRLFEFYKPMARTAINPIKGIVIDLVYGFIMAIMFLLLYPSLSGDTVLRSPAATIYYICTTDVEMLKLMLMNVVNRYIEHGNIKFIADQIDDQLQYKAIYHQWKFRRVADWAWWEKVLE
jgi:hypothetical protein